MGTRGTSTYLLFLRRRRVFFLCAYAQSRVPCGCGSRVRPPNTAAATSITLLPQRSAPPRAAHPLLQPVPLVVSLDGASVHGLDGLMVPYPRIPQQQLLPLDQNGYSTDLYRQGLTPPQLPGDHLHPYGRRMAWRLSRLCIRAARSSPSHEKPTPPRLLKKPAAASAPRGLGFVLSLSQKFGEGRASG